MAAVMELGTRHETSAAYPACIACGSRELSELAASERIAGEASERETMFRALFPVDTPVYMLKDRAYPTQTEPVRLVACDRCGTLARDPHLSPEGLFARYARDAYHPSWMERSYREYEAAFGERIPELVRWVGAQARVLEVGSFVGGFLAAARRTGWRAEGVDVGDCVNRFALSKGLNVHPGRLEDRAYPSHRFDAVFVWSCFDQLAEPWEQLQEIHRILDDDGRLLIRVPNGEFVRRIQRLERWIPSERARRGLRKLLALAGLAGFPHQVGYTPAGLTRMLKECGFGSIRVSNRINLRAVVPGRRSKALRLVHAGSRLLKLASFGALNWGPWIEVSCSKAPLTLAPTALPVLCAA